MTWLSFHHESEVFAAQAHEALQHGDSTQAKALLSRAANAEARALGTIGPDKPRTLGVTAVSAVALWYKAGKLDEAAHLAHQASAMKGLPGFAVDELRGLLQAIWNEKAQQEAGVSLCRDRLSCR